ncbi:MAG: hypothetical protein AMJ81_08245 [Phycisphaerae bacterium SM23_33]|nr:MAG: hypothetical protein AMJ81_08245 [Phycisphaerae bacterium SM23_33]
MARMRMVALVSLIALLAPAASAQWKPAKGPLMTRWARGVSPDKAHREYPRPQMVRKDWTNLNGLWDYAVRPKDEPAPEKYDGQILVPFPIESALSGVMKRVTAEQRLWYRRTFAVPADWKGKRLLLHFQAVDWDAAVSLNGKKIGTHRGGYDAFTFDITEAAKPGKDNELIVGVFDPTAAGAQPRGIWYTPTTGIWQTVWLEPVGPRSIQSLKIVPDVDAGCLRLTVIGRGTSEDCRVHATALDAGKEVAAASGKVGQELRLQIAKPKLWSPDTPHLYDLKVALRRDEAKTLCDAVESYFGMRKVSMGKTKDGFLRILLNNQFVFQIGFLDQGFWPDGLYTAATDDALRYDVEVTRKLGMNLARKHVKIEPDRWYYWCDKLGLLVWQDMPSGSTTRDRKQFRRELTRLVEGMGNHPSIIMWIVFNEGWGQNRKDPADTKALVDLVRKLDPSRLVSQASGWADHKVGDIIDVHSYPGPAAPKPEDKRAGVLGEFGGLGLGLPGHTWAKKTWGYRGMADRNQLTTRYVDLLRKVHALKLTRGLSAAVYTQTSDVETECNGLMTYDRAIIKPDIEKVAAANRGEFPPPPIVKPVVPTSQAKGIEWRYTTEKPAKDWAKSDFDDSSWQKGPGGFGTRGTPGSTVRTEWKTPDIWIRRTFELPEAKFTDLHLRIHHDEDAEVYLNGVLAARARAYTVDYEPIAISPKAKAALNKGTNVFAVHCKQTGGGQYIDVGRADLIPRPKEK